MDISSLPVIVIIYLGLNILAFFVFTCDKLKAKVMRRRISEKTLLLVAVPGPFGALTAMIGFRHKIFHIKFILVPVFAILHVVLIILVWPWLS